MKAKRNKRIPWAVVFAIVTLITVVSFVTVNTVVLSITVKGLEEATVVAELNQEDVEEVYEKFVRARGYLGITVNHNDISKVEDDFAELRGAIAVGDEESAAIAKSRLITALSHLRRLSGFNLDSII